MHFLIVIYTECKSLAKWWGVVPWYLPLRFGRGQKYPPLECGGGGSFPLELQISLKKSHLCQFLMDSKDLYICGSAMLYTILQKTAAILNFHVNMPPSWILCAFGPFLTTLFSAFGCITAQSMLYILMPHTLRKKPYIKGNCSVYRLYHFYSIQNMLFGLSL